MISYQHLLKNGLLIVGATALLFFGACNPCGKGYDPRQKLIGIEVLASDNKNMTVVGDTIQTFGDSAFFRFNYLADRYVRAEKGWSFFPEAIACSPADPYLVDPLDSVDVIATERWDASHDAGSSLADIISAKLFWTVTGFSDTAFTVWREETVNRNRNYMYSNSIPFFAFYRLPENKTCGFYIMMRTENGYEFRSKRMVVKKP
jgi:hypothetical protein